MQSCLRAAEPLPIRRGHRPTELYQISVLNLSVALDHSLRGSPSSARLKLVDAPLDPSFRAAGFPGLVAHRCLGKSWLPRMTRHLQVATDVPAGGWPLGQGPCQDEPDQQQTAHLHLPTEMTGKKRHRGLFSR